MNKKKQAVSQNKLKAYMTNAVTEIYETETDTGLPVASDNSVEEARDWANDGNNL